MSAESLDLAQRAVRMALDQGATGAECTIAEGDEFSVVVRMREIESLKDAGSRGAGLRALIGKRTGSAYTSDLSPEGIAQMVASAIGLAQVTTEDPFAGLPDPGALGQTPGDFQLYSDEAAQIETEERIERARACEEAALEFDARIANSEGASFDASHGARAFANSLGFAGAYRTSSCVLSMVAVAKEDGSMERDYWRTVGRRPGALESPQHVGRTAAQRALRRLKARKVATQKVPIVFEPRTARSLIGDIYQAVAGDAVYRKASFLADRLGDAVASKLVTVIDDGTLPGLFGSSPFDDEGVPTRRTVVLERGVLKSYLLNTYSARKLGLATTGNASRGLTGSAGVGHTNLFLEPGPQSPEEILRSIPNGFHVTELIGSGVNIVTGDFSQGAAGLWIDRGELAYPVSEVTIAGNLKQMLADIAAVGSDLEFRGSIAAPTVLIAEMTVGGQ